MIYEIINPSDKYTLASDDPAVAAVCCMMLGGGKYALEDEKGKNACPMFIFGGDPHKWLNDTHGTTIDKVMEERKDAVIVCFRSVMIGDAANRILWEKSDAETKAKYHDQKRTSMNDIGKRANQYADHLAESLKSPK